MKFQDNPIRAPLVSVVSFLLASFIFTPELKASSSLAGTSCFRFEVPDSPSRSNFIGNMDHEVWCYQKIQHPAGSLFIYNADSTTAKPELAVVVEPDGTLTHGSLLTGEISVHRVHSAQFNPFSIPLTEPDHLTNRMEHVDAELESSAQEVLQFLISQTSDYVSLAIQPGRTQAEVPETAKPWRGYWWAYRNQTLSSGNQSVMAKFDRYVKARTGQNPGAQDWENSNHQYEGINWEGHCNGWAASSVIRPEPRFSRVDPKTGTVFKVADQKGLLAEKDYCVKLAFFGKRYRGNSGDDIKDIYPQVFHQTLLYYIGTLGKPVAMDYRSNTSVDNNIVSGYRMKIDKISAMTYAVSTTLTIHKYDKESYHPPGIAPSYELTYRYNLQTDAAGNLIGGAWKTGNPDFLWVPLSPTDCSKNNPIVSAKWVDEIMTLPRATSNP